MKLKKISALFLAAASVAGVSYAGTFGFEDVASSSIPQNSAALQNNAYSGGDYGTFKTSSQGVTASLEYAFSYDYATYSGYWGGGMVSNQKGNSATTYTDDLQSKPGGAASGNNFGIIYVPSLDMSDLEDEDVLDNRPKLDGDPVFGDAFCSIFYKNFPNPTSLITDTKVEFASLDIALTAYDYYTLENGNSMTGTVNGGTYDPVENPYKSISNTDGSFFALRIYGLLDDSGTLTQKYVDTILAKNYGGEAVIVSDWMKIDVSALNAESEDGLKGLSFQIISNFGNGGGLTMPNYIAIDNVNFNVPEPAEFAAIFGLAAIAAVFASKRFSSRK